MCTHTVNGMDCTECGGMATPVTTFTPHNYTPHTAYTYLGNYALRPPAKITSSFGPRIAVEPFKNTSAEKKQIGAIVTFAQKVELAPLRVVFGNEKVGTGALVHVPANLYTQKWAQQVFELEGRKFILLPESEIVLVTYGE